MFEGVLNWCLDNGKFEFLGITWDKTGCCLAVIWLAGIMWMRRGANFVSRLGEDEKLRNKTGNVAKFLIGLWRK